MAEENINNEAADILQLPIEKQRELAEAEGMSLEDWVMHQHELSRNFEEHERVLEANKGKRPSGWTDKDTDAFQKKVDSSVSDNMLG
jgi:hypothetical protein